MVIQIKNLERAMNKVTTALCNNKFQEEKYLSQLCMILWPQTEIMLLIKARVQECRNEVRFEKLTLVHKLWDFFHVWPAMANSLIGVLGLIAII